MYAKFIPISAVESFVFLFSMHINFPFGNIKRLFLLWNMLKYDFMKYRHRLLDYRVALIYIRYT
jgi:hypothetical protein